MLTPKWFQRLEPLDCFKSVFLDLEIIPTNLHRDHSFHVYGYHLTFSFSSAWPAQVYICSASSTQHFNISSYIHTPNHEKSFKIIF